MHKIATMKSSSQWKYYLYKCYLKVFVFSVSDCWHQEPHERPAFFEILQRLHDIASSSFISTPRDSFHTMQEDWRLEIEQMFDELRSREKVSISVLS